MPFVYADRVRETSISTGTANFTLAGAVTGFRTFASGIGAYNTCYYSIVHRTAAEWEVGFGTLDSLGTSLARTAIQSSSTGSVVSFSAGTKDVFTTFPAVQMGVPNSIPGGRLSLSATDPLPVADLTASGAGAFLYYLPYTDSNILLYDGRAWVPKSIGSGITLNLQVLVSNQNYDIFVVYQSGNPVLLYNGWSTETNRSGGLSLQDGILVLTSSPTWRYVGTIRTTAAQTIVDSTSQRYVWNYYHRAPRPITKLDGTASWTYSSTVYQYARAQATNRIQLVNGYIGSFLDLMLHTEATNATAGQGGINVLSYDSSTTFSQLPYGISFAAYTRVSVANQRVASKGIMMGYPGIGYHYVSWLERIISSGITTFYGAADSTGIQGWWEC